MPVCVDLFCKLTRCHLAFHWTPLCKFFQPGSPKSNRIGRREQLLPVSVGVAALALPTALHPPACAAMGLLTMQEIDDVRTECFADDIDFDESMMTWTRAAVIEYFESGGEKHPVSAEQAAGKEESAEEKKLAVLRRLAFDGQMAGKEESAEEKKLAVLRRLAFGASSSSSSVAPEAEGATSSASKALAEAAASTSAAIAAIASPPHASSASSIVATAVITADSADSELCVPCDAAAATDADAAWTRRDARLLAFLETAGLLRAAGDALSDSTLAALEVMPRLDLLAHLKDAGMAKITERQQLANALAKAVKDGTLPPLDVARPKAPPPVCDACDGPHLTDACPHFSKAREEHPDASQGGGKRSLFSSTKGPQEVLHHATAVRQPGDGSCLFHSLAHGLRDGTTAPALRRQVADFVEANAELEIADSPLKDWVQWDAELSVSAYCTRMRTGSAWGGGIEMAAAAHLKGVDVLVYETDRATGGYRRIGTFEPPPKESPSLLTAVGGKKREVRILYQGGVHYDALELGGAESPTSVTRAMFGGPMATGAKAGGVGLYPYNPADKYLSARGGAGLSGGVFDGFGSGTFMGL